MKNMILLRSLRLNNFISHEDTTIQFGDSQKLLIDGNSGGGKSAVLESIIWALYGLGRTDNRSLVRHGSKKATVVLTLGDGEHIYEIERSIASAGKHTLVVRVDGVAHPETRVRELQAWIENDLIGASYLLFVNSIAYLQGGADTFVTQNASRRKELLLEIVKTGDFDAYYERVKTMIGESDVTVAKLQQEGANIRQWLYDADLMISSKENIQASLLQTREEISALVAKQEEVAGKLSVQKQAEANAKESDRFVLELQNDLRDIDNELLSTVHAEEEIKSLDEVRADRAEIDNKITVLQAEVDQNEIVYKKHMDNQGERNRLLLLKPMVNDYSNTLTSLNSQREAIKNNAICPAGDACPHEKSRTVLLPKIDDEITSVTMKIISEKQAFQAWREEYDKIPEDIKSSSEIQVFDMKKRELAGLVSKRSLKDAQLAQETSLRQVVEKRPSIEQKRSQKEIALNDTLKKQQELYALVDKQALAALESGKNVIDDEIRSKRQVESVLIGKLAVVETYENKRVEQFNNLSIVEQNIKKEDDKRHKLSLLREAFGSKGIKTVVLDWLLPTLEDKINEILSQMSDFRVHLDTQQVKADGEGNKEGLFITIVNELGNEMSFDSYSGGERLKLVVSISEALATLQKAGFRLMDEVFAGLDENATESFVQVLERLQSRFPQVVCISHLQQIKDVFEQHLMVTKNNGISYVTE